MHAMADTSLCSSCNSETKIFALKDALCTQQQLLQKLYIELEEEREASATAASEALSMILRLQGEKAAEKMEAIHYKRMAEEKIQHTEESLIIFRELMYEKEMEIASLEHQVQAYRCKLLGIGSDPIIAEMKLPHNPFMIRNEAQFGELSLQGILRRSSSPPVDQFNGLHSKVNYEIEEQGMAELYPKKYDEDPDREFDVQNADMQSFFDKFTVGDICSYREQIEQLDEQLKEFSHSCSVNRVDLYCGSSNQVIQSIATRPCSMNSVTSKSSFHEPIRRRLAESKLDGEVGYSCSSSNAEGCMNLLEVDETNIPCFKAKASGNSDIVSSLYDIFEVPNDHENNKICQMQRKESVEGESRLKKPEPVLQGTSDCCSNDESELEKNMLQCAHLDNKISGPRDGKVTAGCHIAVADPKVGIAASQAEVQKLHKRLEKLECERRILKQEIYDRREEELMLLKEINQKLNMVQSDIRCSKVKNCHQLEEFSLVSVMEAMLFYSL